MLVKGAILTKSPQSIKVATGESMLTNLEVSGYRGFKSYRMDGLTRVNLLVGKNNTGKTALLEEIHLLTSGGDVDVLTGVAMRRGEVAIQQRAEFPAIDITHFFNGHIIALNSSFKLVGSNGYPPVVATIIAIKES